MNVYNWRGTTDVLSPTPNTLSHMKQFVASFHHLFTVYMLVQSIM